MKEKYFSKSNLSSICDEFIKHCSHNSRIDINILDWQNTALLILDMQQYFLNPPSHAFVPSSPFIVPKLIALANLFQMKNLPVFCTRHVNKDGYDGLMSNWWKELIVESHKESMLIPEIQDFDFPVYHKQEYDAFYETALKEDLNKQGIKTLVITGVMTHLCVETTVRSAFIRGFQPILPVDGTATYNENFHKASLTNLSHGFAVITTMDKLIDGLSAELNA